METQFICGNCGNTHNGTYGSRRFCSKKCARSFSTKEKRKEINEKVSKTIKENIKNNSHYGFIKDFKVCKCKYCNKDFTYKTSTIHSRLYCSTECKNNYINEFVKPKWGGYRQGSGRGHKGHYKGFYLDSTWELAFLVYHLDQNSNIKRCEQTFEYTYNGQTFNYHLDFELDGVIYEIKGFATELSDIKFSVLPKGSKILYEDDMKFYIDYCLKTYNVKKLEDLYDNSNINEYECSFCKNKFYRFGKKSIKTVYCSRQCAGNGVRLLK